MAVYLCRSGEAVHHPPPAELRNAPRLVVRSEPVTLGLDHRGKKINARSDLHYACAEPTREVVWKKNYARRSTQLTQCGFHGPPNCPYKDVGEVELNDRRLIQEGLGQMSPDKEGQQQRQHESGADAAASVAREGEGQHLQASVWMTSPYRVRMRAKTPSQFPTELASLDEKLDDMKERLELVRKGRGLFKLMKDREMEKQCEEQLAAQMEEETKRNAWAEPEVTSEISLSNVNINGSASLEASIIRRESSVALDLEALQEKLAPEERGNEETPQLSNDNKTIVEQWYRQLCVLVWVLEAMRMENPSHMTPLSQCWRYDSPTPDEATGRKRAELFKTQLHKFDTIVKEHKQVKEKPKFLSVVETIKTQQNTVGQINPKSVKRAVRWSQSEEEKMRRQKKLTPGQMENLMTMLEEELNYSKKQSRCRINALMREAGQARTQSSEVLEKKERKSWQLPPISLDVSNMERQFSEAEEAKRMIVHEQLKAMERDHGKATQQRFGSLQVSGNIWQDLKAMRQGVEIETTSMARRRLLMNYEWFPELLSELPDVVKSDHYCRKLLLRLADLADYMNEVGPWKMSKKKLTQVLASFRPWELCNPDIEAAVQFIIQHVIYIVAEDYSRWLHQHKLAYEAQKSKTATQHAAPPNHGKLHVTF